MENQNTVRIEQLELDKIIRDNFENFINELKSNAEIQSLFSTKASIKKDIITLVEKKAKSYIDRAANQAYQIKFK